MSIRDKIRAIFGFTWALSSQSCDQVLGVPLMMGKSGLALDPGTFSPAFLQVGAGMKLIAGMYTAPKPNDLHLLGFEDEDDVAKKEAAAKKNFLNLIRAKFRAETIRTFMTKYIGGPGYQTLEGLMKVTSRGDHYYFQLPKKKTDDDGELFFWVIKRISDAKKQIMAGEDTLQSMAVALLPNNLTVRFFEKARNVNSLATFPVPPSMPWPQIRVNNKEGLENLILNSPEQHVELTFKSMWSLKMYWNALDPFLSLLNPEPNPAHHFKTQLQKAVVSAKTFQRRVEFNLLVTAETARGPAKVTQTSKSVKLEIPSEVLERFGFRTAVLLIALIRWLEMPIPTRSGADAARQQGIRNTPRDSKIATASPALPTSRNVDDKSVDDKSDDDKSDDDDSDDDDSDDDAPLDVEEFYNFFNSQT